MTRSGPRKTTSNISGSVQQHLKVCALAIISVVVSMPILSQPSEARVVYTPTNVPIRNSTYNLDLNNDGIADFSISESEVHKFCAGVNGYGNTLSLNVTPTQGDAAVESGGVAAALNKGAPIDPHRMYSGAELVMASAKKGYFETQGKCQFQDIEMGDWLNVTDHYLGFALQIHGRLHFGWARLSVYFYCPATYCFLATSLTGYAYETVPGKSIKAGQTHGNVAATVNTDSRIQEEEAPQHSSLSPDKAQGDYLAADKILFGTLTGRCLVHFEIMTGYCITPSGGVCHSDYKPSFCPPGKRAKHIKTFQCATEFAYVAAHRTCP